MAGAAKKIKIAQDQVLEAEKQWVIYQHYLTNLTQISRCICLAASRQAFSNGSLTIF